MRKITKITLRKYNKASLGELVLLEIIGKHQQGLPLYSRLSYQTHKTESSYFSWGSLPVFQTMDFQLIIFKGDSWVILDVNIVLVKVGLQQN